jgi:hypothetical protein
MFTVYNSLYIVKFVLEGVIDGKLSSSYQNSNSTAVIILTVVTYFCALIDIWMLIYFLHVTSKFFKMLFDGPALTKVKKYSLSVILGLMSFCILMSIIKQILTQTYMLLVNQDLKEGFDCSRITPSAIYSIFDLIQLFFYTQYFTCYLIGYYIIGICYVFTFEYYFRFAEDQTASADLSSIIQTSQDLSNT